MSPLSHASSSNALLHPQATGKNTFFGKTASMIQSVDGIGHLQMILMRIVLVLVVMSVTLCLICLIYLCTYGNESFKEALTFAVVLLVASIPIAIEIVCTATLALGSRQLSSHGAIVTRLASIEEMAGMNMLCSDKTGTLTLNKMVIQVGSSCRCIAAFGCYLVACYHAGRWLTDLQQQHVVTTATLPAELTCRHVDAAKRVALTCLCLMPVWCAAGRLPHLHRWCGQGRCRPRRCPGRQVEGASS